MQFSEEQIERYSRQIVLPEVGVRGQVRISAARVLIVGAGGLGSPSALFLAAAGVGRISIVDDDNVDLSNLQRQVAHRTDRVGTPKVESIRETLAALNPDAEVEALRTRLGKENAEEIVKHCDVVVDGSDNFPTRYLLNDICVSLGKPLVSGAILGFEGQVTTILPGQGHCYRCLYPAPPPPELAANCQQAGVFGAITGVVGSLQAAEVLKLILGKGEPLVNRLLIYDALKARFRNVRVPRDPDCGSCNGGRLASELRIEEDAYCSAG